ncbi:MAG: glycosyltransferase family 4 protein [Amphiplicatus sp.]
MSEQRADQRDARREGGFAAAENGSAAIISRPNETAALPNVAPVVCYPFVGRDLGGSHVSTLALIKGVDPRRYRPRVLLQHLEGPIYEFFRDNGVPVDKAPDTPALVRGGHVDGARLLALLSAAPRLARKLRRDAVAIVHCNDGRTAATWALAGKLAGCKVVWHNRGNPDAIGLRFAAPFLADRIVSVSRFASPRPGFFSAFAKNEVVFSPFDTEVSEDRRAAREALAKELNADPSTAFIGYFGSLVARKRPLLFVDAIAALRGLIADRPVMGVMFGEPRDREDAEVRARAAQRGVADAIRLMGYRTPGSRWIAACDALLVPAAGEPLGRTLVEAMLVGTPVVATESGGNPEAVRHGRTGWLAPAENAGALADAVASVLRSPDETAQIVRAAADDARARFGAERHIMAIMRIYDELMGETAPSRPAPAG